MTIETQTTKNIKNYFKQQIKETQQAIRNSYKQDKEHFKSWALGLCFYRNTLSKKQFELLKADKMTAKELKEILLTETVKHYNKSELEQLNELNKIYAVDKVEHGKIAVDWVNNRTWGNCPRGSYANCFEYVEHRAVTGCGYDKLSTLTASFLNNDLHFKRVLVDFIDRKRINTNKKVLRDILGYGISTCEGLPYIEDAVGASCHVNILKNLGYDVQWYETKKTDIFVFDIK